MADVVNIVDCSTGLAVTRLATPDEQAQIDADRAAATLPSLVPSDAERLAAATVALAPLEMVDAPYTTADIVDVLLDVKTALGG